jgi:hypothetical protein
MRMKVRTVDITNCMMRDAGPSKERNRTCMPVSVD